MKTLGTSRQSVLTGVVLYLLDVLVVGGLIAGLLVYVTLWHLLRAGIALLKQNPVLAKQRAVAAAITVILMAAMVGSDFLQNRLARVRAESIIAACERYRVEHERYPNQLGDLVPKFIQKIPPAKLGITAQFRYFSTSTQDHSLMYTVIPPFARRIYRFEEARWVSTD